MQKPNKIFTALLNRAVITLLPYKISKKKNNNNKVCIKKTKLIPNNGDARLIILLK